MYKRSEKQVLEPVTTVPYIPMLIIEDVRTLSREEADMLLQSTNVQLEA